MNCDIAREALSARLDGEPPMCPPEALEEHLAGCVACREWQEAARVVTRRVRLTPAPDIRDRTDEILAAVFADQAGERLEQPRRGRVARLARAGLVAAALAQFVIIVPAFTGHAGVGIPPHASRELGAFNLALAAGFLAAAVRPALARGMTLLVGTATAALLLVALVDSSVGDTTVVAEAPHLIALAGWLLLYGLAWSARCGGRQSADPGGRTRCDPSPAGHPFAQGT